MKTENLVTTFLEAKQYLSPRTLEQYGQALHFLAQQCPDVPDAPHPLREALSKITHTWVRDAYWRTWQSFFHWYWKEYDTPSNPMQKVERPKLPEIEMRFLEPEELAHVVAAAGTLQDKAIVALALDSGVRASEFGRLRPLDIGSSTIWLWGKGRKRLQVPISPETCQLLRQLISQNGTKPDSLLFLENKGQPISRFAVYKIVRKCMDKAGVAGPKRGPHCLRHSLGTNFIANGGDAFTLKRIMRHTNIATTQKYVHLAMRTVVEQHRQHSPLRDAIRGSQGILIEKEVEEILANKK